MPPPLGKSTGEASSPSIFSITLSATAADSSVGELEEFPPLPPPPWLLFISFPAIISATRAADVSSRSSTLKNL